MNAPEKQEPAAEFVAESPYLEEITDIRTEIDRLGMVADLATDEAHRDIKPRALRAYTQAALGLARLEAYLARVEAEREARRAAERSTT